ncbi:MAG: DUF1501 domain-containing protein [Myxococcota bacterium]|nr:DUF1501 domain-containing protein [Myxococcota bacterium]
MKFFNPKFSHIPLSRRSFLRGATAALGAAWVTPDIRFAGRELSLGKAYAQAMGASRPINFIEINLRDQWDFGHVFVPPGIATETGPIIRGGNGRKLPLYYRHDELIDKGNGFYLTPSSTALAPHLDNIAVLETCELSIGRIHGHEAANATRSPGRGYSDGGGGRLPMWRNEPGYVEQGNEPHYSSTPTPASLHNYWQKQLGGLMRNGIALKGISRFHNCYHFAAGFPDAELDRIQSKTALFDAFPLDPNAYNILESAQEAERLGRLLKTIDARFLDRRKYSEISALDHTEQLKGLNRQLYWGQSGSVSLPLTDEETEYWSQGVPAQVGNPGGIKFQIWEQVAYAFKLIESNMATSVALEFDYVDVHDSRPVEMIDVMALQSAIPLARLIEKLKEANLFDNTVIAVYSLDGGRSPAANSSGNEGKNTVILAGGGIQGGYFGDVKIAGPKLDGHKFSYHRPDVVSGIANPMGTEHNGMRTPGRDIWRTLMQALTIPKEVYETLPDVMGAKTLDFMLRNT